MGTTFERSALYEEVWSGSCTASSGRLSARPANIGHRPRRTFAPVAPVGYAQVRLELGAAVSLTPPAVSSGALAVAARKGSLLGSRFVASTAASARPHNCLSEVASRSPPLAKENCSLRIRCANSMPASVTAAVPKDLNPNMDAHRLFMARWSCSMMLLR